MKSLLLSAALLVCVGATAQASCSTASLAGSWAVNVDGTFCTATVNTTGVITGCGGGRIAMTTVCKFSGSVGGVAFVGRSEVIPGVSALKPNLLLGSFATQTRPITAYRR